MGTRNVISKEEELKRLRKCFHYYEDGTPYIYDFGSFKQGLCNKEIDDYLKVRANQLCITSIRKKFDRIAGANTCACANVNGEFINLMYRHDVERFANKLFDNTSTYFD